MWLGIDVPETQVVHPEGARGQLSSSVNGQMEQRPFRVKPNLSAPSIHAGAINVVNLSIYAHLSILSKKSSLL